MQIIEEIKFATSTDEQRFCTQFSAAIRKNNFDCEKKFVNLDLFHSEFDDFDTVRIYIN